MLCYGKWLLLGISLILCACTPKLDVELSPAATQQGPNPPGDFSVGLVVVPAPDVSEAGTGNEMAYRAKINELMAGNAKAMMNTISRNVTVLSSVGPDEQLDYYVVAYAPRVERTTRLWAMQNQTLTVAVDWQVLNKTRETLLKDTVVGEGVQPMGNGFTGKGNFEAVIRDAMSDMFYKVRARIMPVLAR